MYTVAELIETLKQCPPEYTVCIFTNGNHITVETVGIHNDDETVDLFPY